jgi:hypothetical protein
MYKVLVDTIYFILMISLVSWAGVDGITTSLGERL